MSLCQRCNDTGTTKHFDWCPVCNGRGTTRGGACRACGGSGGVETAPAPCPKCRGK